MGVCVPKHVVCDWYTPVFDPSSIPCDLSPPFDESRSRLLISGALFRSFQFGSNANNIKISNVWQVGVGGSPFTYRDYDQGLGDVLADVLRVKLTVIDGSGSPIEYFGTQRWDVDALPPEWNINGIDRLRSKLENEDENKKVVLLPFLDNRTAWDSINQNDHLAEFGLSSLTGGDGAPSDIDFLNSVRTGPAMTMIYIKNGDTADNGDILEIRETRYWNGYCYKKYDVLNPDCEDPSQSTGSPPTGSPLFCETGPSSDC